MIDEIVLRDLALIREASIVPDVHLTVLTGESGSGKTAFLQGLKLLVGDRASSDMVRVGASELEASGRFFLKGADPDGLVVSRTVSADGRSRVKVDGAIASVGDLARLVGAGVDLCGQHEHQRLAKPAYHGDMLDEWIGAPIEAALASYRALLQQNDAIRAELDELSSSSAHDAARLDEARFVKRRIDELAPQPGEYEELLAEAKRLENLEQLVQATGGARELLTGDGGAVETLNAAISALQAARPFDTRIDEPLRILEDAGYSLEDAARTVAALVPDSDSYDAQQMDELQQRLSGFQALMRSFGPTMEDVFAQLEQAERLLGAVDNRGELLDRCRKRLEKSEAELAQAACEVSNLRAEAAPVFADQVNEWLAKLEMPNNALVCELEDLERDQWNANGANRVRFLYRPGAEAEPRPLARIASGGEMSRLTLAIKAVLGQSDKVDTLVFDEVDAGIGGKTALTVAEALASLAQTHQVIVVTHLAQIAVLADAHFVVEKESSASPQTHIRRVQGDDRVDEIARMLSGSIDEASRAHAQDMLIDAKRL